MKRKVVNLGGSCLMVSIPAKWAKAHDVKKGDELVIEETNNSLVLKTDSEPKPSSISLDISDLDKSLIITNILSAYLKGFDEIHLRYEKSSVNRTAEIIEGMTSMLVGVEIIDQKDGSCILKDLSSHSYEEFNNLLKRILNLLQNMANDCVEGVKNNDKSRLENLVHKKRNIRKLIYFCYRSLNKINYGNSANSHFLFNLLSNFETITEVYRLIGKEKPTKFTSEKMFVKVNELLSEFSVLYFVRESKKIIAFKKKIREIYTSINHGYKAFPENILLLSRLTVIINSIDNSLKILLYLN